VDLDECAQKEGWSNFDAFFTRSLKEGARPIDDDVHTIVSPSDGRVDSLGPITKNSTFLVKGGQYRVEDLVGDADEARRYEGGAGCVIYLSPRDYHRVHSPVDGQVVSVRSMRGDYYPVNAVGLEHVPQLFIRNRRVAIAIDTPPSSGFGRVTVVMVAAMIVGRITVSGIDARDVPFGEHRLSPPRQVHRGDEIGIFRLGSTAVVLLESAAAGEWLVSEGPVQLGRALSRSRAGTLARSSQSRSEERG
jgi:phosphatidylserine decarboxylase